MLKNLIVRLMIMLLIFLLAVFPLWSQNTQKDWCSANSDLEPHGTIISLNGSRQIDYAYKNESIELSRMFGVYPAIFYLQEKDDANATAKWRIYSDFLRKEGSDPNCCPDGTVFLGTKLIENEWRLTRGTGLSLPAILAHEFAHIAQFKYKSPLRGKWRELHADYLAGWFIGHRTRFPIPTNVYQAMKNFYYKGDDIDDHGTGEEREEAFKAGFELNVCCNIGSGWQAYQRGEAYILDQKRAN